MPVTLESIHKRLEHFFLQTFQTDPQHPVFFRLRQFPSVISEGDYVNPSDPASASKALEKFSDLANWLPGEAPDGMKVYFGADLIDSRYHSLLSPSLPFVKPEEPNGQAIVSAFNAIKNPAVQDWDNLSLARHGIPDLYRPTIASPTSWYDHNNHAIWSSHSFEITESIAPTDEDWRFPLWRFALDNFQLVEALPSLQSHNPNPTKALAQDVIEHNPQYVGSGFFRGPLNQNNVVQPAINTDTNDGNDTVGEVLVDTEPPDDDTTTVEPDVRLHEGLADLDLLDRIAVIDYLREKSPTRPSRTSRLKIDFQYCTINMLRPWFIDSFIRSNSWFIPGVAKGSKSVPGAAMNLSALPIEMIAVRNLTIEADWSQVDIEASRNATNFGPFEIKTEIINNKMSHEGIQIIGYLLQRMPDLPPNDPPSH